jgi:outer membrane immunogenic protein
MITAPRLLAAAAPAILFAAAPCAAQSFTGPRLEANTGYDAVHSEDLPETVDTVDGIRLGLAAGYDIALAPRLIAGIEAGIGWSVADDTRGTIGTARYRLSNGRDIDAALRLGYLVAPRTLVYAKAGWANSKAEVRVTQAGGTVRASDDDDGVRLGAGVEQMLGEHAYAKAEYRYTAYGDGVDRHQALLGVGWRF